MYIYIYIWLGIFVLPIHYYIAMHLCINMCIYIYTHTHIFTIPMHFFCPSICTHRTWLCHSIEFGIDISSANIIHNRQMGLSDNRLSLFAIFNHCILRFFLTLTFLCFRQIHYDVAKVFFYLTVHRSSLQNPIHSIHTDWIMFFFWRVQYESQRKPEIVGFPRFSHVSPYIVVGSPLNCQVQLWPAQPLITILQWDDITPAATPRWISQPVIVEPCTFPRDPEDFWSDTKPFGFHLGQGKTCCSGRALRVVRGASGDPGHRGWLELT